MTFKPTLKDKAVDGIRLVVDDGALAQGVEVTFTDREGGVSRPPYDSLNLALRVGDEPAPVLENRRRVAQSAGFDGDRLALARQVHGAHAIEVGAGDSGVVGEADVLYTRVPGVTVGILVADCAPVIVWGEDAVAVVHAGWRGLVAGAIETGVGVVGRPRAAWIGPSIHACCYEVGSEVVDAFGSRELPAADASHVDPGRAAAVSLRRARVDAIASWYECTSCDHRYFSFRRDGLTGRQGAFVTMRAT